MYEQRERRTEEMRRGEETGKGRGDGKGKRREERGRDVYGVRQNGCVCSAIAENRDDCRSSCT